MIFPIPAFSLGVLFSPLLAGDLYVDPSAANCSSGAGTEADPVCTINAALALASAGDTIHVREGIYAEDVDLLFDISLIASGGANPPELIGASSTESAIQVAPTVTAIIDGFTLRDSGSIQGGAIESNGDLTLLNSTIRNNLALTDGGAIHSGLGSALRVEGCFFANNVCYGAMTGRGGAISSVGSLLEIRDSTFEMNLSDSVGGAVSFGPNATIGIPTSTVLIDNCTFSQNRSVVSSGGALAVAAEEITLTNSTLVGNRAGGFIGTYGEIWRAGGGAQLMGTAEIVVSNCTISGNTAELGAGMRLVNLSGGADFALSHLTVVENESRQTYPQLYPTPFGVGGVATSGIFTIANSIVAGNTGGTLGNQDHDGGLVSLGGNVVGIGTPLSFPAATGDQIGSLASPFDPLLIPLALNGGTTPTHALQSGSPALDGGVLSVNLEFDQRGFDRVRGAAPDSGAFEFETLDSLCNGDGGAGGCTPCPCGNDAPSGTVGGCLNESGQAARLLRSGSSSIAAQNLSFQAEQLPSNVPALLISGAALAPANPANPCFGQASGVTFPLFDGLRCVVQNTFRHGVRVSDSSGAIGETQAGWGAATALLNSSAFVSGQERHFQIFFRQDPTVSCANGLGTSQAGTVLFFL